MNSMYDKGIPKCIEKGGEKERKKSSSVSTILWTILFWGETQQKLQKICICTMERDHKKEIEFLRIYDFRFRSSFSFHFCPAKSSRFSPKQKEKKSKGWKRPPSCKINEKTHSRSSTTSWKTQKLWLDQFRQRAFGFPWWTRGSCNGPRTSWRS